MADKDTIQIKLAIDSDDFDKSIHKEGVMSALPELKRAIMDYTR